MLRGALFMVMASALLGLCGVVEHRWLDTVSWSRAAVLADPAEPCDPASEGIPVRILRLPPETLSSVLSPVEAALFQRPEWTETEDPASPGLGAPWLILLDAEASALEPLIASGRLPDPNLPECLAGELIAPACHALEIYGMTCAVSGRLSGGIPAFSWAFVALDGSGLAPVLANAPQVWTGCLHLDGLDRLAEIARGFPYEPPSDGGPVETVPAGETSSYSISLRSWNGPIDADHVTDEPAEGAGSGSPDDQPDEDNSVFWIADPCRTSPVITLTGLAALMLSFLGGALLQRGLLFRMAAAASPNDFFYPFLREVQRSTRLWKGLHGVYYAWVLIGMLAAMAMPALGLFLLNAVQQIFSEGQLAYVGAAYESGDILQAAWATFYNNYIIQTVRNTILVSISGLPVGIVAVFTSLFPTVTVMSPVWTRVVSGYALHSVTMTLELQAYLLAVFAVLCWSRRVGGFLIRPGRVTFTGLSFGIRSLAGATLFIGLQLSIAALYEAITLLLFF